MLKLHSLTSKNPHIIKKDMTQGNLTETQGQASSDWFSDTPLLEPVEFIDTLPHWVVDDILEQEYEMQQYSPQI